GAKGPREIASEVEREHGDARGAQRARDPEGDRRTDAPRCGGRAGGLHARPGGLRPPARDRAQLYRPDRPARAGRAGPPAGADLVRRMADRSLDTEVGARYILVNRYLERIADHAVNIGLRVVYMVTGDWLPRVRAADRVKRYPK